MQSMKSICRCGVWGALAVGAIVMLLCNIVLEEKLMNGSVGEVKKIVYSTREGPRGPDGPRFHPAYAIVNFPDFEISEEDKLIEGMPRTCIPVTPLTLQCKNGCCSATTMPLRVLKAISCHKCQGQTVGDGHPFCKCVVGLPCKNNKTPGLAQVSISRPTSLDALAIDDTDVMYEQILSIGQGPAYQKRRDFEQTIHDMAEEMQVPFQERIIDMDPNRDSPTFDGGFDSVVHLYRSHLVQDIAEAALTPGSEVPSHLIAALHDLMIKAFPIATFSDTVIKPQPGHQYYFEFNEETELLIVLYIPASHRPSFVVRERLPSRKLLFLLFDPASTSDAEQVQAMFEESISDLFEPGMHEWRQVTIPTYESHHDRYLLAAASLTMWLTIWQQYQKSPNSRIRLW